MPGSADIPTRNIRFPSLLSRTIVVNRSVYMCTGYSKRGRARTSGSTQKERKNPGRLKDINREAPKTPTAIRDTRTSRAIKQP